MTKSADMLIRFLSTIWRVTDFLIRKRAFIERLLKQMALYMRIGR